MRLRVFVQELMICTTGPFGLKIKIEAGLHPSHSLSFLALSFSCVVMVAKAAKEDATEGVEFLSPEEIEAQAKAREKRAAERVNMNGQSVSVAPAGWQ